MRRPPITKLANLVRYYPLGVSPTTDRGPNGFDLTAVGTPSLVAGNIDQASDFDGSTDGYKANLQAADKTQTLTYAAWVNRDGDGTNSLVLTGAPTGTGGTGRGASLVAASNVQFRKGTGSGFTSLIGATSFPTGEWHPIALTFDNAVGMKVYFDGVLDGSNADTANIEWSDSGDGPSPAQFYVSGDRNNTAGTDQNFFFGGQICEARTFDVVLTADEIKTLMQVTAAGVQYA